MIRLKLLPANKYMYVQLEDYKHFMTKTYHYKLQN